MSDNDLAENIKVPQGLGNNDHLARAEADKLQNEKNVKK